MIEDLTGYRWLSRADPFGCDVGNINGSQCWGVVDLSTTDLFGFRAMQGGVDGFTVTRPLHAVTPTKILASETLATDAAAFVVGADFELPADQRRLLGLVERDTTAEAAVREQIAWLVLRIEGRHVQPDSADVSLYFDLWSAIRDGRGGDVEAAWTVTIATLLTDPTVLFY